MAEDTDQQASGREPAGLTRRRLLLQALRLTAAGAVAGALPKAAGAAPAATTPQLPPFSFTEEQSIALTAAVARMIPALGPGDWNAADAGAVQYIEQLLNAFSLGGNPKLFAHGPVRADFAQFEPLSRIKALGWSQYVLSLRQIYSAGLDQLNRQAILLGGGQGGFAGLLPLEQDALLEAQDYANTDFFQALFAHTMEGVYSHPVYGGNRNYIAWTAYCYAGDVHGVHYPDGYKPSPDAPPWDHFGGYSPAEMGSVDPACKTSSSIPE